MNSWPLRRLGDIFEIARGGSPRPIDRFLTDDDAGINWVLISDASESSKFIKSTKKRIRPSGATKSRMVHPGDFLLTNSMSFGRPYIMATSGCIHDGWLVLSARNTNDVDQDFFYHLLNSTSVYAEFKKRAPGATVKNLNIELVEGVEVPLPPLDEQRRISAILDQADDLRRKRRLALEKLNALPQAIFQEMFGDPETSSNEWPLAPLGKAVNVGAGYAFKSSDFADSGLGIVRISDLQSGVVDITHIARIPGSRIGRGEKFRLNPGDILMAMSGSLGKIGVVPTDTGESLYQNQRIANFRISRPDLVVHAFLLALLDSPYYQRKLRTLAGGIAQQNVSSSQLESIQVMLPTLDLQEEFSIRMAHVSELKKRCEFQLSHFDKTFASLQHRAFSGQLIRSRPATASAV